MREPLGYLLVALGMTIFVLAFLGQRYGNINVGLGTAIGFGLMLLGSLLKPDKEQ